MTFRDLSDGRGCGTAGGSSGRIQVSETEGHPWWPGWHGIRMGGRSRPESAPRGLVTLRIDVRREDSRRHLAVAGRLTAEEVGELEQAVASDPEARLDLEELRSADAAGLAVLRRLRAEGVEMWGVPPHLAWRIEDDDA